MTASSARARSPPRNTNVHSNSNAQPENSHEGTARAARGSCSARPCSCRPSPRTASSCTTPCRARSTGPCRPSRIPTCTSCKSCAAKVTWEIRDFSPVGDGLCRPARRSLLQAGCGLTLHPPFFSIVEWHFVHSFVLAEIQLLVSESSLHFCNQRLTIGQQHGR